MKKGAKTVTSDHNTIITKLDMKWEKKEKREKVEIFNFKSKSGQQKFKDMTSRKGVLSDIFKNEEMDLASMTKKFMKKIIRILHQCFDKVRVKDVDDQEVTNLFDKRRSLRHKTDTDSKNMSSEFVITLPLTSLL